MRSGLSSCPKYLPKGPLAQVCPRPLSRCVPKVPRCLPSPAWPRAPKLMCARVYPNCVPKDPLPKLPQGVKRTLRRLQKGPLQAFRQRPTEVLAKGLGSRPPRCLKVFTQPPPLPSPPGTTQCPRYLQKGPFPAFAKAPPSPPPRAARLPAESESCQVVYQRPSSLTKAPPRFPRQSPPPAGQSHPPTHPTKLFTEDPPPRWVPPTPRGEELGRRDGGETPIHPVLFV